METHPFIASIPSFSLVKDCPVGREHFGEPSFINLGCDVSLPSNLPGSNSPSIPRFFCFLAKSSSSLSTLFAHLVIHPPSLSPSPTFTFTLSSLPFPHSLLCSQSLPLILFVLISLHLTTICSFLPAFLFLGLMSLLLLLRLLL